MKNSFRKDRGKKICSEAGGIQTIPSRYSRATLLRCNRIPSHSCNYTTSASNYFVVILPSTAGSLIPNFFTFLNSVLLCIPRALAAAVRL